MHFRRPARTSGLYALTLAAALAASWVAVPSAAAQSTSTSARQRASSAFTPASKDQCGLHDFCMWQNADYNDNQSGSFWVYPYADFTPDKWYSVNSDGNTGADNQASSVYNNRGFKVGVNKDWNPVSTTLRLCWPGNYSSNDLVTAGNWPDGSGLNDSISAIWLSDSSTSCDFG
jgi:hypothetical protein